MPVAENLAALISEAAESARAAETLLSVSPLAPAAETNTSMTAGTPRLLVIDTNVVLDLIYWQEPSASPLKNALHMKDGKPAWQAVISKAAAMELAEVLSRPMFALAPETVEARLRDWLAQVVWIDDDALLAARAEAERAKLRCLDPLDQKFFELALAANARALISKDKLVLKAGKKMRRLFGIPALRPSEVGTLLDR